jgi:hypothetical protein
MKTLLLSIIAATILLLIPIVINNPVKAGCLINSNSDWPSAPCYGDPGYQPSKQKQREEWNPYYQYKGAAWMIMMKTQLISAMRNGTIEDWVTDNDSHYDVWRYYYLNDQAPFFRSSVSGLNDEHPYFPPPLQQLTTGIAPKDVACKKGLNLVLNAEDGSPACVKPDTAQKLIERGWVRSDHTSIKVVHQDLIVVEAPPCVSQISHQEIFSGYAGELSCPMMPAHMTTKIVNYTGFYAVFNELNASSVIGPDTYTNPLQKELDMDGNQRMVGNFVLEPGHNATITYNATSSIVKCVGNCSGFNIPTIDNQTNTADFIHRQNSQILDSHDGLVVQYNPVSESLVDNQTVTLKATIMASTDVPRGTYWVVLSPGNCAGGPLILLTVSDCEK